LLANQPLLLTTTVFVQIVVTLMMVGYLERRNVHDQMVINKA
jgi:hypothetical protein